MVYVVIDHEIGDYEMFMQVFSDDAARREQMGCIGAHIWRAADDPLDVTVVLDWDTVENAQLFAGSFELEQAMHWSSAKAPTTKVTVFEEVHKAPH